MEIIQQFLIPFLDWELLLLVAAGTLAGIFIGAIPGLSVTMAVALLLSLTYSWDLLPALALMLGVYYGGVYGGSRAAILVNIPGSPASVATALDGYPMSQKGEAGLALFLTTIFSFVGGLVGVIVLATAAPIVASFAVQFANRDYFLLALLGFCSLVIVTALQKGCFRQVLVLSSAIGMDPIGGGSRFTFGSLQLMNGVDFIIALLGLFGMSEILYQMRELKRQGKPLEIKKMVIPPLRFIFKFLPLSMRVSILGVLTGAFQVLAVRLQLYYHMTTRNRSTKKPNRPFGEGAHAGVIAPEAGNSSAIGGAMIPMLTLGIPGDAVTAIFIGALFIHGLQPGPMLMTQSGDLFWVMVGSSVLANVFLLVFGLMVVSIFIRIVTVPRQILLPIIAVITVIGSYAMNYSLTDVYWMLGFGVIGFFMKVNNFSVAPLVLGIILGPLLDTSFRRAYMSANGTMSDFIAGFFTNPISLVLTLFILFTLFAQTPYYKLLKRKIFRKNETA
ncbi:LOW QUALITY PROTEIN: tricarboxylate transport membrane protein TctA [Geomicrobium sp. JCM 19037]|nr:LOW QUALITY PROTEIN: tricarboxylate transport membrane protein TctA [Geomicrobium sp. JCM 19037]